MSRAGAGRRRRRAGGRRGAGRGGAGGREAQVSPAAAARDPRCLRELGSRTAAGLAEVTLAPRLEQSLRASSRRTQRRKMWASRQPESAASCKPLFRSTLSPFTALPLLLPFFKIRPDTTPEKFKKKKKRQMPSGKKIALE